jgi:predicted dehydrogenase
MHSYSLELTSKSSHSRTPQKAAEFAARHAIEREFGSYEALLECRDIDAMYTALPPSLHLRLGASGHQNGQHVLCEKPLAKMRNEHRS